MYKLYSLNKGIEFFPFLRYVIDDNSIMLAVPGNGNKNEFSTIVSNLIPEKHFEMNGQIFYKKFIPNSEKLFDNVSFDNFNQKVFNDFNNTDDLFNYIYSVLNSRQYKKSIVRNY